MADGDAPAPSATPAVRPPIGGLLQGERAPVIRSKIQPPPLRSSTLSRQRLLDRLTDATASRLTLLIAEAGYGKTTLLADFTSRASARCLWYKLDPTDADPITWTNYVIAAAREVDPTFGQGTLSLLAQVGPGGPPESAFAASLLGEFPRLGEAPTILVLDDFHEVDESEAAREFVLRLLKDAPPWLHFVISTRRRPTLELARLAGMGEVAEITTDDLRFTDQETDQLFTHGYGVALEPEVVSELGVRARGWVASLQLFHGSIRGRPRSGIRALARSLSGASAPIYEFLAQEVLRSLSEDLEEFLMRASLLQSILPTPVVALFRDRRGLEPDDKRVHQWIDEADRLALLSRPSQRSEARELHPLLRDFLARRLAQSHTADEIRAMHRAVADAIASSEPLSASRHYIEAGDESTAVAVLGNSVLLTMGSGQWGTASTLIDRLGGVPADAAVAALRARRLIDEGDLVGAANLLQDVDPAGTTKEARAVFRNAKLSLGWRLADRDFLIATLDEIQSDPETPAVLADIAQVYLDSRSDSPTRQPYPSLVRRLESMAQSQQLAGHGYYSAISLHNAAIAQLIAGDSSRAIRLAERALEAYDYLSYPASERYSTYVCLGDVLDG